MDEKLVPNGEESNADCLVRKEQRLRQLRVKRFLDAVYVSPNALGFRAEHFCALFSSTAVVRHGPARKR